MRVVLTLDAQQSGIPVIVEFIGFGEFLDSGMSTSKLELLYKRIGQLCELLKPLTGRLHLIIFPVFVGFLSYRRARFATYRLPDFAGPYCAACLLYFIIHTNPRSQTIGKSQHMRPTCQERYQLGAT